MDSLTVASSLLIPSAENAEITPAMLAVLEMTEAIERAEMAIERGPPARIMDSLRELRSYEP